jgi:hypothetical protein
VASMAPTKCAYSLKVDTQSYRASSSTSSICLPYVMATALTLTHERLIILARERYGVVHLRTLGDVRLAREHRGRVFDRGERFDRRGALPPGLERQPEVPFVTESV